MYELVAVFAERHEIVIALVSQPLVCVMAQMDVLRSTAGRALLGMSCEVQCFASRPRRAS